MFARKRPKIGDINNELSELKQRNDILNEVNSFTGWRKQTEDGYVTTILEHTQSHYLFHYRYADRKRRKHNDKVSKCNALNPTLDS